MTTIALIGPDGAGKSTIAREVANRLGSHARYLYMGVNLEASTLMLPTTRFILMLKRRRGGRADLRIVNDAEARDAGLGPARAVRSAARTTNWIAEEAFRHLVAEWHRFRGRTVILDRLFFADYHASDVARVDPSRPIASRVHGFVLRRIFRRPDIVVLLDAPADVLHQRKPESSVEYLDRRRTEYLAVADDVPRMEIVDVRRSIDEVVAEILSIIDDAGSRT